MERIEERKKRCPENSGKPHEYGASKSEETNKEAETAFCSRKLEVAPLLTTKKAITAIDQYIDSLPFRSSILDTF
jgi:hypothetical protein